MLKPLSIRSLLLVSLTGLLLGQQPVLAQESEWFFDAEVGSGYDENVGRAELERDIADDMTVRASLGLAFNHEFATERAITLRGFFEAEKFNDVRYLSHTTLGAQFIYRWQDALGFSAPFYQFNSSVRFDQFEVGQRDSRIFTTQLLASKRLTDRILGTIGVEYQRQESAGIVFDQKHARVFMNADYAIGTSLTLYGTYSYLHGDTWSSSQTSFCNGAIASDIFSLIAASEAIEQDEAFNDAFCGNWIAYRLDADINMLTLGLNKSIGHSLSFDFSARHVIVNAEGPNEYDTNVVNASLLMRF